MCVSKRVNTGLLWKQAQLGSKASWTGRIRSSHRNSSSSCRNTAVSMWLSSVLFPFQLGKLPVLTPAQKWCQMAPSLPAQLLSPLCIWQWNQSWVFSLDALWPNHPNASCEWNSLSNLKLFIMGLVSSKPPEDVCFSRLETILHQDEFE